MYLYEISKKYGISEESLNTYLSFRKDIPVKGHFSEKEIDDKYVEEVVEKIRTASYREETEEEKLQHLIDQKCSKVLISSGYTFEGFKITKYSGYISGDDAILVDKRLGQNTTLFETLVGGNYAKQKEFNRNLKGLTDELCDYLTQIRNKAIKELKEKAYNLNCNAIIGIDFDYITYPLNEFIYVYAITANGTACYIEPTADNQSAATSILTEFDDIEFDEVEEKILCKYCGQEISKTASFCKHCGKSL